MPAIKEGELLYLLFSNGHLRFVPRQARIDQVALKDCEVHLARIKLIPQADLSVVLVFCAMFFIVAQSPKDAFAEPSPSF